jgi:hypothetical protein
MGAVKLAEFDERYAAGALAKRYDKAKFGQTGIRTPIDPI